MRGVLQRCEREAEGGQERHSAARAGAALILGEGAAEGQRGGGGFRLSAVRYV